MSFRSLSFRLLLLTVFFVMLSEVLIYTPSVARFRLVYLEERIEAANLAVQAVRVSPDGMLSEMMTKDLLAHVDAHAVMLLEDSEPVEVLSRPMRPVVDRVFDIRTHGFFEPDCRRVRGIGADR